MSGKARAQTKIDGREGPWQQTCLGRRVFLYDPRPEDFVGQIEEIAEQISKKARYGGATAGSFYGNAEHSVLVSCWAEELAQRDGAHPDLVELVAKQGLLHDSTDAYFPDIPRPVKHDKTPLIPGGPSFRDIWKPKELRLLRCIYAAFGVVPTAASDALIERADREVLFRETQDLMIDPELSRDMLHDYAVAEFPPPLGLEWNDARNLFLQRYYELWGYQQ